MDKINIAFIKPSSANINNSLKIYTDSVEIEYRNQYTTIKKDLNDFLESENKFQLLDPSEFDNQKKLVKIELKKIDSIERESLKFKYYEYFSYYSKAILTRSLEQYEDYFKISEIKKTNIKKDELSNLAKLKSVDYIIIFDNIETITKNDAILLSSNLILYSSKKEKIILKKKIYGNTENIDRYFPCKNPLLCLFVNSSKNALEIYLPKIIEKL